VAVVTGGTGVLGGEMARGLARAGARVAVMGRRAEQAEALAGEIGNVGGAAMALPADVLDQQQLLDARARLLDRWGRPHILVNAAGGNMPAATIPDDKSIFDLDLGAFSQVMDLNLMGTVRPGIVFGEAMARPAAGDAPGGCIVNVSSMTVAQAVTRVVGYSAGKAAMENFTRWMAVELARKFGEGLRVNALAPGFFIGEQNRALLVQPGGSYTTRGQTIVAHTPAGRFGEAHELVSTLIWLCGPGATFINGIVVPIDGGFSAFTGV
jgi:NAD(P)-dependent dehydrogenase (short-subunit alcohol dehydrogenase family)